MQPDTIQPRSFHITTYGCQMNFHDSERLSGILAAAGWREAADVREADAVILITCCVRQSAEDRFWGYLNSLKPLKRERGSLFAVGGCIAQNEGTNLFERAPHVDLVFGTHQYPHIADLLDAATVSPVCALEMSGLDLAGLPLARCEEFRAWVPIIYGCDNFCSYCVVPFTRGRETSRPREELLAEISGLIDDGAREVVLLGQNVNSYGKGAPDGIRFATLLGEIAGRWPHTRIRFLTSHPRDFSSDIIEAMAEHANICRFVHLPLQAGSDRILQAMRRGYDRASYLAKVEEIRERLPGVAVTSDLMVGFPGEEEDDFLLTLDAVRSSRYDQAYTYIYNRRAGTAAADGPWPEVPHAIMMERFNHLAALVKELSFTSNQSDVGKVLEVLVEGEGRKSASPGLRGRTTTNKVVNFAGGKESIGTMVKVEITRAGPWSLGGMPYKVIG
jgi:tRNA-2-methylthio-N6-dimethylallyladenosine synthase